jgi:hypothetical protein
MNRSGSRSTVSSSHFYQVTALSFAAGEVVTAFIILELLTAEPRP